MASVTFGDRGFYPCHSCGVGYLMERDSVCSGLQLDNGSFGKGTSAHAELQRGGGDFSKVAGGGGEEAVTRITLQLYAREKWQK